MMFCLFDMPLSLQTSSSPPHWREVQRKNFTRVDRLADFLELTPLQREVLVWHPKFPLQVPFRLAEKMEKGSLSDPMARQFLPLKEELHSSSRFVLDPVCDASFRKGEKLLHKYQGRVLLVSSGACAMHCRYCFRQNFDYSHTRGFDEELALIEKDASIREVILSGGDPLSLSDEVLSSIVERLNPISHIDRIRFHTRFPMGIPERIDEGFLQLIASIKARVYFVIHANHPREFDPEVWDRLHALQKLGCQLLNQAVLLKGVNDDLETLIELATALANHAVLFYYLHQLDLVQGAAHFEVDEAIGRQLVAEMASRLPGYAVPKYVREIAGATGKTRIE